MLLISFHPARVTEYQTSPAPPWNRGRLGVFQGSAAGGPLGYRISPKTGQIGASRGRRSLNAPTHLAPYDNRPRRDYRRGRSEWRARRDSNPQPSVSWRSTATRSDRSRAPSVCLDLGRVFNRPTSVHLRGRHPTSSTQQGRSRWVRDRVAQTGVG